jgi:hypothetical protein
METVALLGGILMAIVFVAERLAFAVMLYMLTSWIWKATAHPRALLHREILRAQRGLRTVHQSILHWWAMRSLRGQMARGATP